MSNALIKALENLEKHYIQEAWFHSHSGMPRHPIRVKDHASYFSSVHAGGVGRGVQPAQTMSPSRQLLDRASEDVLDFIDNVMVNYMDNEGLDSLEGIGSVDLTDAFVDNVNYDEFKAAWDAAGLPELSYTEVRNLIGARVRQMRLYRQ